MHLHLSVQCFVERMGLGVRPGSREALSLIFFCMIYLLKQHIHTFLVVHSLCNGLIAVPDGLLKLLLWFLVLRCHSESVSLLLQCSHLHTQQCHLQGDKRDECNDAIVASLGASLQEGSTGSVLRGPLSPGERMPHAGLGLSGQGLGLGEDYPLLHSRAIPGNY